MSRFLDRIQNRLNDMQFQRLVRAASKAPNPSQFTSYPEPTTPGNYSRGLQYLHGEFLHEQQIIKPDSESIWDLHSPNIAFFDQMNGFDWMDDLAAVNTMEAKRKIQAWTMEWIARFGRGQGHAWRADLIGWRAIRLITHAPTLLGNQDATNSERYFETIGLHVNLLKSILATTAFGIDRFVGLVGWLFATLALNEYADDLKVIIDQINAECDDLVQASHIYLPSRNPQELSEIFALLVWADNAMMQAGADVGIYHDRAIDAIGQALRSLRLTRNSLIEAQGGGDGNSAEIDRNLSMAQIQGMANTDLILGFAEARAAGLTLVMDAAAPPTRPKDDLTQASTLGIWVADGEQKLIIGSGAPEGQNLSTRLSCQETNSHTALTVGGQSSSLLCPPAPQQGGFARGATITHAAQVFGFEKSIDTNSILISASHDGYSRDFGLIHERKLNVERDGLFFAGIDILRAETADQENKLRKVLASRQKHGIPLRVNFHLGPQIEPSLDMNNEAVSFKAKSGHLWVFRQQGGSIEITDHQLYQADRLRPISTKSIAVHSRLVGNSGYISWSFQAFDP